MSASIANQVQLNLSTTVSGHARARSSAQASETFSRSLAAASRNLVGSSSVASSPNGRSSTVARYLHTASLTAASRDQKNTVSVSGNGKTHVVTPFGEYDLPAADKSAQTTEAAPRDSLRDYFRTHQPGEWFFNPTMRELFAQTYGEKALVTLDYTGTVPENEDPTWVTHVQLDSSGKPFPRIWNL